MKIRRILSVDDSDGDQLLNKTWVEAHDPTIEFREAFDGEEALEVLSKDGYEPDLIFLDVNMPRMGGIEFLEEYASRGLSREGCAVVMLSSSPLEKDKAAARRFSCVKGYLVKPLSESWFRDICEL